MEFTMTRTELIQHLIDIREYVNYLEIGVASGDTYSRISCRHKTGVDPDVHSVATVHLPSDSFFAGFNGGPFDIVFIDGLHLCEQVSRDIENSLRHLARGGCIVLHDCLPGHPTHACRERRRGSWTGDVWRAVVAYFARSPYLCYTVDTDWGCGVIDTTRPRDIPVFDLPSPYDRLQWDDYVAHRGEWLNIRDVCYFQTHTTRGSVAQ